MTLIHLGRRHIDNDVVAGIATERIVFAGDLVEEGEPPCFEESSPLEWPDALGSLMELDPEIVIRRHGAAVDLPFIPQQRSDLQQLAELARRGFATGRRPLEFDVDTAFPGRPAQAAVRRAYEQLAAASTGAWMERQPG